MILYIIYNFKEISNNINKTTDYIKNNVSESKIFL